MTAPKITLNPITLPRRGRGEPITVELLGTPTTDPDTGRVAVDTASLRGAPIIEILNLGQERGYDPSEMVARGFNAMAEDNARGRDTSASLAQKLIAQGLAETPTAARLVSMHIRSLGKRYGLTTDDDLVELAQQIKARGNPAA